MDFLVSIKLFCHFLSAETWTQFGECFIYKGPAIKNHGIILPTIQPPSHYSGII